MHTLLTYQRAAVPHSEDQTSERLILNLVTAIGHLAHATTRGGDVNTIGLKANTAYYERFIAEAEAGIGASLHNLAVIADRFGLSLADIADGHLKQLARVSESGRLRALAGEVKK